MINDPQDETDNKDLPYRDTSGFPDWFFMEKTNGKSKKRGTSPQQSGDSHKTTVRKTTTKEAVGQGVKVAKNEVIPKAVFRKDVVAMSASHSLGEAIPGILESPDAFVDLVTHSSSYASRVSHDRIFGSSRASFGLWSEQAGIEDSLGQLLDIEALDEETLRAIDEGLSYQGRIYRDALGSGYAAGVRGGTSTDEMVRSIEQARGASSTPSRTIERAAASVPVPVPHSESIEARMLHSWLMSTEMSGAVVAEAWARCELYLRSGWAERDINNEADLGNDAEAQSIRVLGRMAKKIRMNKNHPGHGLTEEDVEELGRALSDRLDTLCMPVEIIEDNGPTVNTETKSAQRRMIDLIKGKTAGTRMVDVVMRGADGKSLYVASVTANPDLDSHGRQHVTHVSGIMRAVNEAKDSRFSGIDPSEVHFLSFASATIGHKNNSSSRRNLMAAFNRATEDDDSLERWDNTTDVDFVSKIGLLKLYGRIAHGQSSTSPLGPDLEVPVVALLRTRLCQFGAFSSEFDRTKSTGKLAEEAAELVAGLAAHLGAASKYLQFQAAGSNNPNRKVAQIVDNLVLSIRGIGDHFGSPPGFSEPEESPNVVASKQRVWNSLAAAGESVLEIAIRALAQTGPGKMVSDLCDCASYLSGKQYRLATTKIKGRNTSYISCAGPEGKAVLNRCMEAIADEDKRRERCSRMQEAVIGDNGHGYSKTTIGNMNPIITRFSYWMSERNVDLLCSMRRPSRIVSGAMVSSDGLPLDCCGDNRNLDAVMSLANQSPGTTPGARHKRAGMG